MDVLIGSRHGLVDELGISWVLGIWAAFAEGGSAGSSSNGEMAPDRRLQYSPLPLANSHLLFAGTSTTLVLFVSSVP